MGRKRSAFILVFALFFWGTNCSPAMAGTTGVVSGHVFDYFNGRPVRGATVEIAQLREPSEMTRMVDFRRDTLEVRTTDSHGFYVFLSLEPGFYILRTEMKGMHSYCPPRVIVFADQTSFIDLAMTDLELFVDCGAPRFFGPP